jgi:hypothetical protein
VVTVATLATVSAVSTAGEIASVVTGAGASTSGSGGDTWHERGQPDGSGSRHTRGRCRDPTPREYRCGAGGSLDRRENVLVQTGGRGRRGDDAQRLDDALGAAQVGVAIGAGEDVGFEPIAVGIGQLIVQIRGGHLSGRRAVEGLDALGPGDSAHDPFAKISRRCLRWHRAERLTQHQQPTGQTRTPLAPLDVLLDELQRRAVKLTVHIRLYVL